MTREAEHDPTDSSTGTPVTQDVLGAQRARWLRQAASAPNLHAGKREMFSRTLELLQLIANGTATDLEVRPHLSSGEYSLTWRKIAGVLRSMGLIENRKGTLELTTDGAQLLAEKSPSHLASLMADRVRLFAEVLGLLVREPLTVEEANAKLVETYNLDWKSVNNTRLRMTWLEVLGLTEWLADRKQTATQEGRKVFETWETVSPEALTLNTERLAADIPEAPTEIAILLDRLSANPGEQETRKTYNIWVPSPASDPNKVENLRVCIAAAEDPIPKEEFLAFIANRFELKRSSVDSMLPFMRASGLLQEVRRGVFSATPAAKAWLTTGSDIDFIRILHGNMRFVGELLRSATTNVARTYVYTEGARYGMNKDKVRWLISFLIDAGLLLETSWSSVQATPTGRRLTDTLPLAEPSVVPESVTDPSQTDSSAVVRTETEASDIATHLVRTAADPAADGKASGAAFEAALERAFQHMGFQTQRIGGSGDTDVLVQWHDAGGVLRTAIVDGKSTASGHIAHGNVNEFAIGTHKDRHSAEFVAIVAPSFSGDTITKSAQRKGWVLVTASELGDLVLSTEVLGLHPNEIGMMFEATDGHSRLADLIDTRQRELDIITLVIARLKAELEMEEPFSPRDVSLIERKSELAPSVDELLETFSLLDRLDPSIVQKVEESTDPRYSTYRLGDVKPAAMRLRALAAAIERGL
ncbi:restriction endonuclease [Actinomadura sp. NPDC000929]|uniref:restriction endonuclease n=1 Tax=Actinomadura sp. NPDC000929 TaxID=3154517 RepID=UPI0033940D67